MFISSEGMRGLCGSLPRWKTKISFRKKTNKSPILLLSIYLSLNISPLFDIPFSAFTWHVFNFQTQQWSLLLAAARTRCEPYSVLQSVIFLWKLSGTRSPKHHPTSPHSPRGDSTAWHGIQRHWPSQVSARRQHWESKLSSSRAGRYKR